MNPQVAQQLQATMMAHINEHIGFEYRLQIEKAMGMQLPPMPKDGEEPAQMPPEMADQIAQMAAQASQQILMQNQQQAQQQQAQQQAQDPLLQLQQQEVQIKQAEQQRKAAKDMADIELEKQKLALEEQKIQIDKGKALAGVQQGAEKQRYDALKSAATMKNEKEKMMLQAGVEALKEHYKPQKTNKGE
jgi:hypothetical protein